MLTSYTFKAHLMQVITAHNHRAGMATMRTCGTVKASPATYQRNGRVANYRYHTLFLPSPPLPSPPPLPQQAPGLGETTQARRGGLAEKERLPGRERFAEAARIYRPNIRENIKLLATHK
jgi:hypothetical protein